MSKLRFAGQNIKKNENAPYFLGDYKPVSEPLEKTFSIRNLADGSKGNEKTIEFQPNF